MIILEENFKWHLEAFASELFICIYIYILCSLNWGVYLIFVSKQKQFRNEKTKQLI